MKQLALRILKYVFFVLIFLLIIVILIPFDLFDMKQAQRIAKWKSVYEQIEYSFSLIKLYEGTIIPQEEKENKSSDDDVIKRIIPYMNLSSDKYIKKKYRYRKMNGHHLIKNSEYFFDKFFKKKDGVYLSIKKTPSDSEIDNRPLYIMFVDINGKNKPNKIGKDIFFINIYEDKITALGKDKPHSDLKSNCSPIGEGFYCSEYYLLGGRF